MRLLHEEGSTGPTASSRRVRARTLKGACTDGTDCTLSRAVFLRHKRPTAIQSLNCIRGGCLTPPAELGCRSPPAVSSQACYHARRFRGRCRRALSARPGGTLLEIGRGEGPGNLTVSPGVWVCAVNENTTHTQNTGLGLWGGAPFRRHLHSHQPCQPPQQMVRLVFRPYTQVRKAICTSAHLRASTRVSSGFALLRHSSPSFGSQQTCSHSNLSQKIMVGRWCRHRPSHQSGYLRFMGLPPTSSHACYTPWSVFQDG
jgi:hypothetical protein